MEKRPRNHGRQTLPYNIKEDSCHELTIRVWKNFKQKGYIFVKTAWHPQSHFLVLLPRSAHHPLPPPHPGETTLHLSSWRLQMNLQNKLYLLTVLMSVFVQRVQNMMSWMLIMRMYYKLWDIFPNAAKYMLPYGLQNLYIWVHECNSVQHPK